MNANTDLRYFPSYLDIKGLLIIPNFYRYYCTFSATSILRINAYALRTWCVDTIYLEIQLIIENISYFNWLYLVTFVHYYLVFPEFYWTVKQALNPPRRTAIQPRLLHAKKQY